MEGLDGGEECCRMISPEPGPAIALMNLHQLWFPVRLQATPGKLNMSPKAERETKKKKCENSRGTSWEEEGVW